MKFLVTLEQDEDGYTVASCPIYPGATHRAAAGKRL